MFEGLKASQGGGRSWRLLAAGSLSALALLAAPPAAGAHELGLVVVTDADTAAGNAIDGLRLAIDQSPDVSHAPGPDAGDHLGGIDVDVTVVERGARPADTGRRVGRATAAGARIVVVLPAGSDSREIVPRIRVSGALIVVAGTRAALPEQRASPVVLLGARPVRRADRERAARFERAFVGRFGRAPDRADRQGYAAGRLVDRVLARLAEGPFVEPGLSKAVERGARALVGATASVVPAVARSDDAGATAGGVGDGGPGAVAVTAAVLAVTLLAGSLAWRLSRRRRGSGPRQRPPARSADSRR